MNQGFSAEVVEGEADQLLHRLARRQLAEVERRLALADVAVGLQQHLRVERLLVADVVVEHALVGAGPFGDPVDPRAVEPVLDELLARGLHDVAPGPRRVARPPLRRRLRVVCGVGHRTSFALTAGGPRNSNRPVTSLAMDFVLHTNKRRLAIVGTGHRGAGTWAWDAPAAAEDEVELVGLSDANPARLAVVAERPRALRAGRLARPRRDARTRPGRIRSSSAPATTPMPTSSCTRWSRGSTSSPRSRWRRPPRRCRRILDAEARTGRRVDVAFNYRFAPTSRKIRELLAAGRIGEVSSVDFHWYLDTKHGADYFRRWHAYKRIRAAFSCTRRPITSTS